MSNIDIDQNKLRAIAKKIRKHLEAMLQLAHDAGVKRPMIYIESEHGLHIMDTDHPDFMSQVSTHNKRAVVCSVYGALPDSTDMGAW